jgi:hypothetical protein
MDLPVDVLDLEPVTVNGCFVSRGVGEASLFFVSGLVVLVLNCTAILCVGWWRGLWGWIPARRDLGVEARNRLALRRGWKRCPP